MGILCRTRLSSVRFPLKKIMSSLLLPIAALVSVSAFGQGVVGEFVPDVGFDLSGNWNPLLHEDFLERIPGPELVNYSGLPITEGSRLWGESWNSSRLTLPEHQCQVHVSPYIYRGPLQMRFWDEKDPQSQKIIAIKNYISTYEQTRTIWMDGRPHRRPGPPTPGWDFPPASGKAIFSPFTPRISSRAGCGVTAFRRAIRPRWWNTSSAMAEPDARQHRYRSGVSHRAAGEDRRLRLEHQRGQQLAVSLRRSGRSGRPAERRGAELSARPEPVYQRVRRTCTTCPLVAALGGPETMYPEFEKKIKNPPPTPSKRV